MKIEQYTVVKLKELELCISKWINIIVYISVKKMFEEHMKFNAIYGSEIH